MVLRFVPTNNARKDRDHIPCFGENATQLSFSCQKSLFSYRRKLFGGEGECSNSGWSHDADVIRSTATRVCVCVRACMYVHVRAWVHVCPPVHKHFVYFNCCRSENLVSRLCSVKLVNEAAKSGYSSSISPLQIQSALNLYPCKRPYTSH
jgi:hypothetical protein